MFEYCLRKHIAKNCNNKTDDRFQKNLQCFIHQLTQSIKSSANIIKLDETIMTMVTSFI